MVWGADDMTYSKVDSGLYDLVIDRQGGRTVIGSDVSVKVYRRAYSSDHTLVCNGDSDLPAPVNPTLDPFCFVTARVLL